MIIELLGILDLITAGILVIAQLLPKFIVREAGIYLFMKGFWFLIHGDLSSFLDCLAGLYIILITFGIYNHFVSFIVFIFLVEKGVLSLAAD